MNSDQRIVHRNWEQGCFRCAYTMQRSCPMTTCLHAHTCASRQTPPALLGHTFYVEIPNSLKNASVFGFLPRKSSSVCISSWLPTRSRTVCLYRRPSFPFMG